MNLYKLQERPITGSSSALCPFKQVYWLQKKHVIWESGAELFFQLKLFEV